MQLSLVGFVQTADQGFDVRIRLNPLGQDRDQLVLETNDLAVTNFQIQFAQQLAMRPTLEQQGLPHLLRLPQDIVGVTTDDNVDSAEPLGHDSILSIAHVRKQNDNVNPFLLAQPVNFILQLIIPIAHPPIGVSFGIFRGQPAERIGLTHNG